MFPLNFKKRTEGVADHNGDRSTIDRIGTTLQRRLAALRKRALDLDDDKDKLEQINGKRRKTDEDTKTGDPIDEFYKQKHRQEKQDRDDDNTSSDDDDDATSFDDGRLH